MSEKTIDIRTQLYEWTANNSEGRSTSLDQFLEKMQQYRSEGKTIITTNGCFDLLHIGHLHALAQARAMGDVLIVGLNSDDSVRRLKGVNRPVLPEQERAAMLLALKVVDHVLVFGDDLPDQFISVVRPHIHCKSGDYEATDLPEARIVHELGGEVRIIPLVDGYSTSRLVQRIIHTANSEVYYHSPQIQTGTLDEWEALVTDHYFQSSNLLRHLAYRLVQPTIAAAQMLLTTIQQGGKIIICGNGGSAADAQHMAAELVGRFRRERRALPAIALTTDSSILTSISNDYGYDQLFARQLEALSCDGDILVAISTSGTARNVLSAVATAHMHGLPTIGLTGNTPSPLAQTVTLCLQVPTDNTALIQQAHITIIHILCELLERSLFTQAYKTPVNL